MNRMVGKVVSTAIFLNLAAGCALAQENHVNVYN